tara:strand:+ start:241 stop:573 length:333 start_codon:yes stop_codon:yes gene_type:complete
MFVKIFGVKCRAEVIIVSIIIGIILGVNVFCGSMKNMEGMSNLYDYKHDNSEMHLGPNKVNNDKLFFFEGNKFKAECCEDSSISSAGGCACVSSEQKKFLLNRGGNSCAN